jgi:hypothetical protein
VRIGLVAACALAVGAAPAMASMPDNDVQANFHRITSRQIDGIRVPAFDMNDGVSIVNKTIGIPSPGDDSGDPPFVQPANGDSTSNCAPTADVAPAVTRTVWYEIVPSPTGGDFFPERTVVSLDAVNTTYTAAIEVFAGSLPGTWSSGDPLPNIVACSLGVGGSTGVAPYVSFQATPHVRYYAVVGSLTGGGTLSLNMRESDVQAPALSVSADSLLPNPLDTTHFTVMATDLGSGLDPDSFTASLSFRKAGTKTAKALASAGACNSAAPTLAPGTYCETITTHTEFNNLFVRWPDASGAGSVRISVADLAGNRSPASYTLNVADRIPPQVLNHSRASRWRSAGAMVQVLCSESGLMKAEFFNAAGSRVKQKSAHLRRRSATSYIGRVHINRVGHGFFTVRETCIDLAGNFGRDYTFLYIP